LPPGTYRFRVQASNQDGAWHEAPPQPAFVRPSFTETGWFYGSLAGLAVVAGICIHRVRVRVLKIREEALQERVRERTQELQEAEALARLAKERAETALAQVKQLRGLLPICSYCKKIRDDGDYWHQLESYLSRHSDARFSHGICPDCYDKIVEPELEKWKNESCPGRE
jgi:hypothetical protein